MFLRRWRNIWRLAQNRTPCTGARLLAIHQPTRALSSSLLPRAGFSTQEASAPRSEPSSGAFDKLRSGQVATGAVNYDLLVDAVSNLSGDVPEEQVLYLVECCGRYLPAQGKEARLEVFRKVWRHLKEQRTVGEKHYIAALGVLRANQAPLEDFEELLREARAAGLYEELVWLHCSRGDVVQAEGLLDEMRSKRIPLGEGVFNALILGHSRAKDLKGARGVLEVMSAAGVESSGATYAELARAYLENGDVAKFEEIIAERSGSFSTAQVLLVLKSAAWAGAKPAVKQLVKQLPSDFLDMKEIPVPIRVICTELVYRGLADNAFAIIEAFPKPVFSENQDRDTFAVAFLRDVVRASQPVTKVVEYCGVLVSTEKNARALHVVCEAALRRSSPDALKYLQALSEVEPLRPHYFWPLLLSSFRSHGEAGLLGVLKSMSSLKTECDYETLSSYVLPRLSITLENVQDAIRTLEKCGLKASDILTPLVSHLISQQKVDSVAAICELHQAKLDTENFVPPLVNLVAAARKSRDYKSVAEVVGRLSRKSRNPSFDFVGQVLVDVVGNQALGDDAELWRRLLPELRARGASISPVAAEVVSEHLRKFERRVDGLKVRRPLSEMVDKGLNIASGDFVGASMVHPKDMGLEELECHLIELQAKGLNARGVLRRLLQLCVRAGKLERAMEVKAECDRLKVHVSPGMMASVFDMYVKLNRVESAEACYREIRRTFPDFLLDEHKIIDFAAALVGSDRYEDARKLLEDRARTRKIIGGDYVSKNVWNLLTNCATSPSSSGKTKELFLLLVNLRYCRPQNILLGPIIRAHLVRKDIKGAVREFKEFAEKYRKTPLQFEVMSQLVALSNAREDAVASGEAKDMLQEVVAASAKVHGSLNTNSTLVLAVADAGTEAQLRKLLINPEVRLNSEVLMKNCEHLSASGKIEMLLKLAKAGRGMGHVVKEQDLYNILLGTFVRENNCAAAMELFERLEADDDSKVSQEFLRSLVNLFKLNNFEVPASVALRVKNVL